MTEQQEKDYILKLKSGDKNAYKALFEHYYPLFHSFASNLLRDEAVVDDVVQNVFMKIWIHRERLDELRSLKNYLLVSVRNEIFMHYRDVFSNRKSALDIDIAQETSIEAECSAHELNSRVNEIVSKMPKRRREAFTLSRVNGMSNTEIASHMGLSVRTVEKHIELALRDIRNHLSIPVLLLIMML